MKILIIVDCYLPSTKSSAKLIHDLAHEFARQKHDVIVVTPDDKTNDRCQITSEEDVTVVRIKTGQIKGTNKIVRAINEIRLSSTISKHGRVFFKQNRCDLIIFYSPSIFWGSLVRQLKDMWKCKSYLILRDIFPQWALDAGVLKDGPVCRFFRHMEKKQYKSADIIAVQSPANLDYFSKTKPADKHNFKVLYNWMDLNGEKTENGNHRKKMGLDGKIVFFYGGNIGVAQDVDSIVELAKRLQGKPQIHFLLVGDGSEINRLKNVIQKEKLVNISFHPPVSQHEYLGMLSEFDVGLIALNKNLKTHNFPGKMLGYMYASMPILASINKGNDLKQIIEGSGAGLICHGGQIDRFHEHVLQMLSDADLRKQMGHNARKILEGRFSVGRAVNQILSDVCELDNRTENSLL